MVIPCVRKDLLLGDALNFKWFLPVSLFLFAGSFVEAQMFSKCPPQEKVCPAEEPKGKPCTGAPCEFVDPYYYGVPLGIRVGYYCFYNKSLREVYDSGLVDFQVTTVLPIFKDSRTNQIAFFGSVGYLHGSGHSVPNNEKTKIKMIPLSAALRYSHDLMGKGEWYFYAGPRYVFVGQENQSNFVQKHVSPKGLGGFAGIGIIARLHKNIYVDVYFENSYCVVKGSKSGSKTVILPETQVGGVAGGLGINFLIKPFKNYCSN